MKTFTTYAEKKAKQFLNLLQGYTKGIRITAILILLLMGVSNAWAVNHTGGYIYFLKPSTWTESKVMMFIGHNSYTSVYEMTKIANTDNLYRYTCPSWDGATYVAFANAGSVWGSGSWGPSNRTNATHYTNVYNNYGFNSGSYYVVVPASTSNNAGITINYKSSASNLNLTTRANVYGSTDGGSIYSSMAAAGTVSVSGYYMSSYNTASTRSAVSSTASQAYASTTLAPGSAATFKATANTGYEFVGWFDAESGGTAVSTSTTYTYKYDISYTGKTVYARFKQKQHTVLFGVHSSGHGSLTAKVGSTSISSGNKVNYGSEVVFTATPSTGYQIEGWYSNSACTTPIDNGTNDTYTVTITGGTNVYVKFEEIPANSHNITYTEQGTGWTYGNSNPTTAEEGATVTFEVIPTTGYTVTVTSSDVSLSNNGNIYTFTMPTKDVKITVEAKPEQYTVTLNKQSGTGGTSSVTATYLAAMPSITAPTRTGYTFNGYFDATSGGTKYYNANGSSAKNWDKTSNTTLYAQWTANTYTVKFNANGGTGSMSNQSHTYGVEKALTANAFTRKGYTFLGWSKTSSGEVQYTDKQTVKNLTANNNSTVNLYAIWQALPPTPVILKPNDEWKQANARYAIYYWGDGQPDGWVEMTDLGCSGEYFTGEVPASYLDFKFVRLDPSGKDDASKNNGLHWDYKWNETNNLTAPAADKNLYDMELTKVLYLKPNDNWKNDGARFAAYFFKQGDDSFGNKWMSMSDSDGDGIYNCNIPTDKAYPNVIFCRMNGGNSTNDWSNKWNQTGDLTIPTDGKNLFDKPNDTWDGATTSWSTIYDNSKWTTYTVPTYTININAPEAGSIAVTVGGSTTTVTDTPKQITNIAAGTTFTIAYTPNAGFELGHSEVEGIKETYDGAGTYTVCGPVDITAHFVTEEDQVVYLRPNGTWLSDNAIFYAYVFNRYGDDEWIELTTKETDYTGAYGCTIPAGYYSDVIFVRLNPNGTDNSNNKLNFHNAWNQSVDYVIPVNTTNNRFIIGEKVISGGDEGKYQGSWEASDRPIYGIPGDWQNEWAAGDYPLMGPDGEVTVNITQTNDTLGFKVYQYPYGSDNNSAQWLGNNGTMVRGGAAVHEGGWTMETSADNCGLGVDVAGDYVFHFNIRESKLTVQYPPMPVPVPSTITLSAQRIFEDAPLNWIAGNGTEANPYQLYVDETARLTVTPIADVPGLTTCYHVENGEEQTSNIIDFTKFSTTATSYTVSAYYKNAAGATSDTVTVQTPYIKGLPMPFYLMTSPSQEINIDRIAAGENILVQFRSDAAATVGLYLQINDSAETKLTDITNSISKDYTHDVDDNIKPCILHYIARSAATVHGRTFEAKADVAIYKNVIIKVNDPDGWVKNAYMWRDYSDAVKTQWPGEPVLQNFGTWRVFSVKYPYYDRFIVNDGNAGNSTQTIDWELPDDDTCYELLDPADNGSSDPADTGKYGLQKADCPENLLVEDIKDTTIMEGEQIVVMPKIFVGLGYQVADIETNVYYDNTRCIKAMMSGTNVTILGNAEGESKVTVTYILDNVRIEETFKVTVTKKNKITIQVKVPIASGGTYDNIGWSNNDLIKIHYWFTGKEGDIPLRYVYEEANKFKYLQAEVPLDAEGKTNFLIGYDDINENWEKTADILNVETDGCYTLKNAGWGNSPTATLDGIVCWDENDYAQYQVKILMGSGKTFTSNIVTAEEDTLSFFAPGMNETGYKAGVIMLYQNDKMIATIEPSTFAVSNVYTATLNDALNGLDNVSTYSGNFYIRTWGTDGDINNMGWHSVKEWNASQKKSRSFTEFTSREGEFYNHYWVQAMNTGGYDGKDVSACVANDYNDDLAGKLLQDKHTNEYGDIKVGTGKVINVRFGYDPRTNYFGRAIIKGSEYDNYLNIHCDNAYKDKNCSTKLLYGTSGLENKMQDISNWVYQRDIYVPITNSDPSASLYIEATSPSTERTVTDHLLGYVINEVTGEESNTPVQRTVIGSGTTNGTYLIRVVYDFKTNRIIAAWLPQGTVDVKEDRTLNADVLFVRQENNEVPQIQLAENGKIRSLESMFFALELHRGDADKNNRHQEQYWFTLPFDCKVGSISGVPGYMQIWGIQRYRGDLRAQKGWYAETPTFWEWLDTEDVMHAGEGYLLVFDKKNAPFEEIEVDKKDANGDIIPDQKEKISMMRLYFPSMTSGFDMQQQSAEQLTRTYENHTCTLTLHNRDLQDSNWKVIGTTSYNNAGITGYTKDAKPYEELSEAPSFRYQYEYTMSNDNKTFWYKYTPENGQTATYNSFYGYMVQFAGTINWQPIMSETVPEGIAARRRVAEGERTSYTTRLELANANGEKQDQTFVALDEKATTTFDQNKDLNKVLNRGTNIYTLSEGIPFAGNTLPMEQATVPVGLRIDVAGEYTFRMPDGTDGISVILVDNETGEHTDMLLSEYTVTLNAGTCENRFSLVLDPQRTSTEVENVGDGYGDEVNGNGAEGIKKYIIDGHLVIRTADAVYDAQGQRL